MWVQGAVLVFYGLLTLLLGVVGFYYGLIVVERLMRSSTNRDPSPIESHPTVTIQVPVFNERHVVDRILNAIVELDWPPSKLQVQVIDDSIDDTTEIIAAEIKPLRDRGIDVEHIQRDDRTGYKAGATQAGLRTATGEFIALFDADFVPPPDFLNQTIPHFRDPVVGCVQTRWRHLNEDYSWFTRAQALALDAHFAVEQWVRARAGSLMSFNATSCVWRRETIAEVGGWSSETVAEDLDLTARGLLRGWRFVYTEGYSVPCEIPVTLSGFVRQQTRWARGSAQNIRKHLPDLLSSRDLTKWAKFHSIMHVLHYIFYPFLVLWLVMHVVVTVVADVPSWVLVGGFLGATPGPLAFLFLGQTLIDRPGFGSRTLAVVPLTLIGIGIAWRMTKALVSGILEMGGVFRRTPKFGIEGPRRSWRDPIYDRPLGTTTPEVLLGCWCTLGAGIAVSTGATRMAPSLGVFALSFWTVVGVALWQR